LTLRGAEYRFRSTPKVPSLDYLPLFAQLARRACLVIGGGAVAERRVSLLLEARADVTVLAPRLSDALERLAAEGRILAQRAAFDRRLLEPYWLIVAATDDRALNTEVARAAEAAKRFCNVVDDPELCSFIMPAIIDRGPITIAVSSGGRSPVVTRWIKGVIETLVPARVGRLAELAGRWRERVRDAIAEPRERRRFWESIVAGPVAEHCHAGRDDQAEAEIEHTLAAWRDGGGAAGGEAYLVGAGPGSPDLITLRGRQLLSLADVVLYDRLVGREVLSFARRDAELISVGKAGGKPSITQEQINRLLVERVTAGQRVCRLKGGDPLVFGRGGEELEALAAAGLPFQIVPGVSAVEGCAAYAGIPLTLRGVAKTVVLTTGHTEGDAPAAKLAPLEPGQTLAFYMGVTRAGEIAEELIRLGHDPATPAAIVEHGTTADQRVLLTTLDELEAARDAWSIGSPALLLVGETTRLAERYAWFAPGRLEIFRGKGAHPLAGVC
jgi:uroporphyrin-III C-methyltransferase / precorrin-2 dehydrogenase / sirohydrochlorin ferrochelatase